MALDFTKAPTTNPFALIPKGYFIFTVSNAEMRSGKDTTKPPYLNVTFSLTDAQGAKVGNLFDIFTESEQPAALYKLQRFLTAVGLDLSQSKSIELRDIAKMILGRKGVLEVEHTTQKDRPEQGPRAQVKLFGSECFWPLDQFASLIAGTASAQATAPADVPWDDSLIPPVDPVSPEEPGNTQGNNY